MIIIVICIRCTTINVYYKIWHLNTCIVDGFDYLSRWYGSTTIYTLTFKRTYLTGCFHRLNVILYFIFYLGTSIWQRIDRKFRIDNCWIYITIVCNIECNNFWIYKSLIYSINRLTKMLNFSSIPIYLQLFSTI